MLWLLQFLLIRTIDSIIIPYLFITFLGFSLFTIVLLPELSKPMIIIYISYGAQRGGLVTLDFFLPMVTPILSDL